ncbi:MAG: PqqD family protein [Gemmatimonadaceae bacterium]
MTDATKIFAPVRQDVAGKVIDGEAIIMNLTNGAYYSVDAVGAVVWQWIDEEQPIGTIVERLQTAFPASSDVIARDLDVLLSQMMSDGLVQEGSSGFPSPVDASLKIPATYTMPTLNKYTEMADLLALDPPMPSIGSRPGA